MDNNKPVAFVYHVYPTVEVLIGADNGVASDDDLEDAISMIEGCLDDIYDVKDIYADEIEMITEGEMKADKYG